MSPPDVERARSIVKAAADANHATRRLDVDADHVAHARQTFAAALGDDEVVLVAARSVLVTHHHLYANLLRTPVRLKKVAVVTARHQDQDPQTSRMVLRINGVPAAEDRYLPTEFLKDALERLGEEHRRAETSSPFAEEEFAWIAAASARSGESVERTSARLLGVGAQELSARILVRFMHDRTRQRRPGEAMFSALAGLGVWAATALLAFGLTVLGMAIVPGRIFIAIGLAVGGGVTGLAFLGSAFRLAIGREDLPEERLVAEWIASRRAAAAA